LPVEGRSEIDGSPKGVTFNSFILPGSDPPYLRGELNAWQVNDTTRYAEPPPWPWWHHFIGPIWEDHSHAQPQVSPWHVGPTAGHQGLVEIPGRLGRPPPAAPAEPAKARALARLRHVCRQDGGSGRERLPAVSRADLGRRGGRRGAGMLLR
jgi:hypothetical protein